MDKSKYPVNQLQMGYTNTQGATPQGYGAGNMDPHQMGYMGQTLENRGKKYRAQKKRPLKKTTEAYKYTSHGLGTFPDYPQA